MGKAITLPGFEVAIKDPKSREVLFQNLAQSGNRVLGICEQLRFIYDVVYQMPEGEFKDELTGRLIDALGMAKKMGNRLTYYGKWHNDGTGHKGSNLIRLFHNERRRRIRGKRKI